MGWCQLLIVCSGPAPKQMHRQAPKQMHGQAPKQMHGQFPKQMHGQALRRHVQRLTWPHSVFRSIISAQAWSLWLSHLPLVVKFPNIVAFVPIPASVRDYRKSLCSFVNHVCYGGMTKCGNILAWSPRILFIFWDFFPSAVAVLKSRHMRSKRVTWGSASWGLRDLLPQFVKGSTYMDINCEKALSDVSGDKCLQEWIDTLPEIVLNRARYLFGPIGVLNVKMKFIAWPLAKLHLRRILLFRKLAIS